MDLQDRFALRVPLAVLQLLFTFLLSDHLGFATVIQEQNRSIIGLIVLAVVVLCLPNSLLQKGWVVLFLGAADTAILLRQMEADRLIEPWHALAFVLVTLIVSFSPSNRQFVTVGILLSALYGVSVSRFGSLLAEHGVAVPILLGLVMVLVRKPALVQTPARNRAEARDSGSAQAGFDALTGLPNRAHFMELVERSMKCAQRDDEFIYAILFIDLDGFKPINDTLGHKAGDAVLIETARRMRACLRSGDSVARYGGDEFALLINSVKRKDDPIRVAERVLRKVGEPILAGKRVQVGASIGIALSTNIHQSPGDLIRHADVAMYRAKSEGKNRYAVSDQINDLNVLAG